MVEGESNLSPIDPRFTPSQLSHKGNVGRTYVRKLLEFDTTERGDHKFRESEEFRAYAPFYSQNFRPTWLGNTNHRTVFYDVETRPAADSNAERFDWRLAGRPLDSDGRRIACAITVDWEGNERIWNENDVQELIDYLLSFSEVVGYNSVAFDNQVLSSYIKDPVQLQRLSNASVDLAGLTRATSGSKARRGLYGHAINTLGIRRRLPGKEEKLAALKAAEDPKNIEAQQKVREFCRDDVLMTREVYRHIDPNDSQKWLALGEIYADSAERARDFHFSDLNASRREVSDDSSRHDSTGVPPLIRQLNSLNAKDERAVKKKALQALEKRRDETDKILRETLVDFCNRVDAERIRYSNYVYHFPLPHGGSDGMTLDKKRGYVLMIDPITLADAARQVGWTVGQKWKNWNQDIVNYLQKSSVFGGRWGIGRQTTRLIVADPTIIEAAKSKAAERDELAKSRRPKRKDD